MITEFPLLAGLTSPGGITAGPDGNLWFSAGGGLGRITPAGVITPFVFALGASPSIGTGPDGNVWFADIFSEPPTVGRLTTGGTLTEFTDTSSTGESGSITTGPDGNLWFTEPFSGSIGVARITPAGVITRFPFPTQFRSAPTWITTGPDGNLWFTELGNSIGVIVLTTAPSVPVLSGAALTILGTLLVMITLQALRRHRLDDSQIVT